MYLTELFRKSITTRYPVADIFLNLLYFQGIYLFENILQRLLVFAKANCSTATEPLVDRSCA